MSRELGLRLIDLAAGSMGNCDDKELILEPLRPDDVPYGLPSDDAIERDRSLCAFPYLYDSGFGARAARIIVSTGPLDQPYVLLGNVDFGKLGFDVTSAGAIAIRGIAFGWARRTFSKATPAEVNELLRKQALFQFGEKVDALSNVNHQTDPGRR